MKNKIIFVIVAIVIIAILIWVFILRKTEPEKIIKVGYTPAYGGMFHFIAVEKKFYEKEGLQIEGVEFQSANQMYDAIAKGDIDIVPQSPPLALFINHIKDPGRVKVFTVNILKEGDLYDELIVKNDSPIQSLADLAGKKIGLFPGSMGTIFLKDYLTKKNVDISKIEFIQLSAANQLPALEAGSIDALHAYQPNLAIALVKNGTRAISEPIFPSIFNNIPAGVGLISTKFATENPSLARKIIKVFDQTVDYFRDHNADARAIIAAKLQMEPEVFEKVHLLCNLKSDEFNEFYKAQFQKLVDIYLAIKEIPSQPDLNTLFYK